MPTRYERIRKEQERAAQERQRRALFIGLGVTAAIIVVIGVGVSVGSVFSQPAPVSIAPADVCSPIQSFPSQGATHIKPNDPHPPYNTNPPNSGWHWDTPQEWGIYTTAQVQEQLVHSLEHGGIIVQYNALSAADTQRLTDLVKRDAYHMILAPYPGLPANVNVALTAWTNLQTCTSVDENAIRAFVNAYRDQGPERVP